jgi:2-polyprenyl-3-methyl-5-hydroxy-6-metoxy-1,4-benzoquinol methylase/glycosyltransferase involved in cell wall biosynthesis
MNICTIIAKNYVAHARVLAESFKEHHPEGTCYVLVIDEVEDYIDPASEPFELITPDQLDIDDYEHMAAIYDVLELSTAVKPWLLRYLLEERGLERVAYFDPDIRIYDRLDEIEELTREHELVLIPHITSPLPRDGKRPSEADILISGTYNLGFISLERGERTYELLDWWSERLKTDCVVAPEAGFFVDQRWMDFVHGVMPDFYVLRDPSYNVAYWNLHGRDLTYEKGRYYVDGKPLRFFHFSGFDPENRKQMSKHQSRIEIQRGSALARACNEYADALLANGYKKVKNWPYSYGVLPNGVKLDSGMHRLYRKGEEEGAPQQSIFTPEGADRFVAWLNEPAVVGGEHGVTRYLYEIYSGRSDLRQAFPNLDGPDAMRLIEWHRVHGHVKLPYAAHPSAQGNGHAASDSPGGVNVAGYFRAELGVGETARQVVTALEREDIPIATVGLDAAASRQEHEYETDTVEPTFPVNLICVNADMLPTFAQQAGPDFFVDRYSIGLWWWEINEFPERFSKAFDHLDEVWVGSHFVADAISAVSPIPVVKMTMPVSMPEIEEFDRGDLGLPEGFVFLFVFDYHSVFERKNPLALVEAFKQAFPEGSGASLVLKSINSEHHAEEHEWLIEAAEDHPDIHVIDRYVSAAEKNAMFASCDCYVSLHRSEGFGNTLAEAMYLGKPVIATGYSGNMDFMTPQNSYPVDYDLRPVGENAGPYPPTGEWAEPDTGHAAELMRHVFEHQEEAGERGRRAADDLRRNHSPEAAGRAMAERIRRARARLDASSTDGERQHVQRPAGINTNPIVHRIATTPQPVSSGSPLGRVLAPVRRVLLKLMWPFAMQQRVVNQDLLAAVREVDQGSRVSINQLSARSAKNHGDLLRAINQLKENVAEQSREQNAQIEEHRERIDTLLGKQSGRLKRQSERLEEHLRESRKLPRTVGRSFDVYEDPVAGRVQGYTTLSGASNGAEAHGWLEDIFRGPEQVVRDRQRRYLPFLQDCAPILDAACGRGEFLDLLREQGIDYVGVDPNPSMVERCRDKGHSQVELADTNTYLESCTNESLGAIFCTGVIERLSHEELQRFLELSLRKLKPDGLLIAETVNPHSIPAMKAFWTDPAHQSPVFPQTALTICQNTGFASAFVFYPSGWNDIETDQFQESEYAVVAAKEPHENIADEGSERSELKDQTEKPASATLSADEIRDAISRVEHWYHQIEVAPGIVTPGHHHSDDAWAAMGVPERLSGKRVLDVGARDGYFSFAAESCGAEVLAIDSVAPEHLTSFSTASRLLGSSVEYRTMNVYNLKPEEVGTFDVIFFLGVLYHLRDPMLALDRLWEVARPGAMIWVESHVIDGGLVDPESGNYGNLDSVAPKLVDVPIAQFFPRGTLAGNVTNWWAPNMAALEAMVEAAGFEVVRSKAMVSRGLVVGRKTEDAETNFYRNFDRGEMTTDEGMAWDSERNFSPRYGWRENREG